LNLVRRERLTVGIRLMDGADLEARIKNFDRFAVILEHDGTDLLVFKHAIATIRVPKTMQSYYTASHD
jgi:host factor-I protein